MTCKKIMHHRWIWLPPQRLECGARLPRFTDGFCPTCFEAFVSQFNTQHNDNITT